MRILKLEWKSVAAASAALVCVTLSGAALAGSVEMTSGGHIARAGEQSGQFKATSLDTSVRPVAGTEIQRLLDIMVSPGSDQGQFSMTMRDDQNTAMLSLTSDGKSGKRLLLTSLKSNQVIGSWTVTSNTSPAQMAQISQVISNEMNLGYEPKTGARGMAITGQHAR